MIVELRRGGDHVCLFLKCSFMSNTSEISARNILLDVDTVDIYNHKVQHRIN